MCQVLAQLLGTMAILVRMRNNRQFPIGTKTLVPGLRDGLSKEIAAPSTKGAECSTGNDRPTVREPRGTIRMRLALNQDVRPRKIIPMCGFSPTGVWASFRARVMLLES
jgi:hypothetical protein